MGRICCGHGATQPHATATTMMSVQVWPWPRKHPHVGKDAPLSGDTPPRAESNATMYTTRVPRHPGLSGCTLPPAAIRHPWRLAVPAWPLGLFFRALRPLLLLLLLVGSPASLPTSHTKPLRNSNCVALAPSSKKASSNNSSSGRRSSSLGDSGTFTVPPSSRQELFPHSSRYVLMWNNVP